MEPRDRPADVRVAAVVINSVSHDARVLKEADSLACAGYEIAVFGIKDNKCSDPLTVRDSKAAIHRVEWKHLIHTMIARWLLGVGGLAIAAVVIGHLLWFDRMADLAVAWSEPVWGFVSSRQFAGPASLVCALAIVVWPLWKAYRRTVRRVERARVEPVEPVVASVTPRKRPWAPLVSKFKTMLGRSAMRRALVKAVLEFQPHAVHCHDLNALPVGVWCARKLGCKVIFDSHELYEELSMVSPWKRRWFRFHQRRLSGKVDAFITINDSIAKFLNERYPRLPKAVIIKNATLPKHAEVSDDGRLREAAGVEPERKILLYQGGFAQYRGLDALVKAGPLLPRDWCLVMMGWGKFESELRAIAAKVDPGGRCVRFLPGVPQSELTSWTAGAALGVIPYENVCLNHWYCTPNKLWEYPVAGVPILASPFPEMARAVTENGIGRLLDDPVTPRGIAATVAAISDADLIEMRRNCRQYIARDNWLVYERRLIAVYDELFARQRIGDRANVNDLDRAGEVSVPQIVIEPSASAALQSAQR